MNNEEFKKWNEEMAIKFNPDNYHKSNNIIIRWIEGKRTTSLLKMLDVKPNENVLDLGCGAGNMLEKINVGQMYGVDISDYLLAQAKKKLANYSNIKILKDDVEELSSEVVNMKFDKIICSEVLEHVRFPEKVIDQILKISAPDARIVLSVPNENLINKIKNILNIFGFLKMFFPGVSVKMNDEWHLHNFDGQLLASITESKLSAIKTKSIPYKWMPLRFVVLYKPKK